MCGVVVALGHVDITEPMRRLAHRGIRSKVVQSYAGVVGHVRLPIVGLGEDHDQPMQKDRWTIGFVGELLDFRDGHPAAECDAEVVRDTWVSDGPYGFRQHDGFWGIAALDDNRGRLHVLTDYLGQKPMYYRADLPSAASEPDALLPFGPVTVDKIYMSSVVKWGYCPELERTPYCEIKHVLPGEYVVLDYDGVVKREIIDPLQPLPYSTAFLQDEMEAAVRRRVLSADVPTACLVSGGVDSAIVYTLAKRYGRPVPYFVEGELDDKDYWKALQVVTGPISAFSPSDHFRPMSVPNLRRMHWLEMNSVCLEEGLDIMQEPIDLGSLRPQIALSGVVEERVCLTGDGADELFGGYGRSMRYDSQYSDVFQELPAWHMPRLDRVMMKHRIEVRSPFLARKVAGMALSLPHELRKDKNFLRAAFRGIVPPGIADTPKKALRTPEIAHDREYYSKILVDKFTERFKGAQ